MTMIVVKVEDQALRFQCQMTLEDEDQLRALLRDQRAHNLEICAKELWLVFTAPNGSTVLIKQKEHHEPA
jgi:hypothetical protein